MNTAQELWWRQSGSDHALFVRLRRDGAPACHLLHYLQMATEKLGKAYLWRSGHAPPRSHTGLVRFLRALLARRSSDLDRIARVFGFGRREDLDSWVRAIQALAYALQTITPAEAGDGPNAEYPWPHPAPAECPVDFPFPLWNDLANTGQGRHLLNFIARAIATFDHYA